MIRFILIKEAGDENIGYRGHDYYTIDCEVPELEQALVRGGKSESAYETHSLIACEVLHNDKRGQEGE